MTRSLVRRCASGRYGSIGANPGAALPAISRHRLRPDRGEYYPRAVRLEERLAQVSGTDHKKRLVAILAADAAGYSRLMAADEAATVSALDTARAVFRTQIESTQGRVIDMAGDSVLAVFELATGAVTATASFRFSMRRGTKPRGSGAMTVNMVIGPGFFSWISTNLVRVSGRRSGMSA